MAKVSRLITIDFDLNKKLSESENASRLICELLDRHFNSHLSNDLAFLSSQAQDLDTKIQLLQKEKDIINERVNLVDDETKRNQEVIKKKEDEALKSKELSRWLSDLVKKKEIDFADFRAIKNLENWEDCTDAVIKGELDMEKLIDTAKQMIERSANRNI